MLGLATPARAASGAKDRGLAMLAEDGELERRPGYHGYPFCYVYNVGFVAPGCAASGRGKSGRAELRNVPNGT